jgi:peptide chain release factor subunit 1
MSTNTVFISSDFEEGNQLLAAFGGIGAILRYKTGI